MCSCPVVPDASAAVARWGAVQNEGVHCTLNQSQSFVETLTLKPVAVLQDYHEFLVQSRLLHAKDPDALHVRYRTIIPSAALRALRELLNQMNID